MENLKSFTIKLVVVTAALEASMLLWFYLARVEYVSNAMPFIPPLFMAFTYVMHNTLYKVKDKEFKYFQRTFLMMTTIKILMMMTILIVFAFVKREEIIPFALAFLLNYLVFTFFEARALLLRKDRT